MADLTGKRILTILQNRGAEQDEVKQPVEQLRDAGAEVTIATPEADTIQTLVGDWDLGEQFTSDAKLSDVDDSGYDILVVPGGTLNADSLRLNDHAQRIVKSFASSGRPVASLCHGPWLLVETGLVKDKRATSYISVKTDISNAGGIWEDSELVRCTSQGWTLLTSRGPQDLSAFISAITSELTGE